jgi:uncharacterized protein (UPF0248 family)
MIPIRDLLNRIRWDSEFAKDDFEIGYFDHVEQKIIRVSFSEIIFEEGNKFSFWLRNYEGELISIPFHRIRVLHKDGNLIWQRP